MQEDKAKDTKEMKAKLSTEPYKGVRDFYPEDMFVQNHIFGIMRKTVEKYGYSEYGASILEPTELYRSKTSDEIVNEQTYSFKDRGDRDVTLRPEMTPSVARLVAGRQRELGFPLRWYSIPNVFRYEQPQRGRLREHWQLNVDLFGSNSQETDIEIITIAHDLMKSFSDKIKDTDFEIRINSREWLNSLFQSWDLTPEQIKSITQLLDRKNKISDTEFTDKAIVILGNKVKFFIDTLESFNNKNTFGDENIDNTFNKLQKIISTLKSRNINVIFDIGIVRGFNYYTGMVFEVFDTNPENKRSIFGGGRYNNLTANFGGDPIPAVGFGMGDVTIRDFLETRKLIPEYISKTHLYIGILDNEVEYATKIAGELREKNVNVFINFEDKDLRDHFKLIEKRKIPFALFIGANEKNTLSFKIRTIATKQDSEIFKDSEIEKICGKLSSI